MTDIVASTRLWAAHTAAMGADLAVHDDLMRGAIEGTGGDVIGTAGDSFAAAFLEVGRRRPAAIAAQQALAATAWAVPGGIAVRMGVHLGEAQRRGGGWYGPPLNEAARIMAAAHGGQVVVSEPVARLLPSCAVRRTWASTGFETSTIPVISSRSSCPVRQPSSRRCDRWGPSSTTLPAQRTPLLGQRGVRRSGAGHLLDHRLVSIVGPGGAGKTRVAVEAAGRELGNFDDGVFFVDLTIAATDEQVLGAIVERHEDTGRARSARSTDSSPLTSPAAGRSW